jgi:carbon starvation protein
MCGAISGFHALIASGTTPKMIYKESDIRPIGYGAMVLEGFVAMTALIAACALAPGDYFAINLDPDKAPAFVQQSAREHNWDVRPVELSTLEEETGEKLAGRSGGAVTLAVGMAKVFSNLPGMKTLMSYWYHFVIMFEALFILTLLETGTRVARFVFQEAVTQISGKRMGGKPNWTLNVVMSLVTCFLWGYLLYLGDLKTLWRMLGLANQLLATIALAVGTTYLLMHASKRRYALCTGIPFVFVVVTVFTAGIMSIQSWWSDLARVPANEVFLLKLACLIGTLMLLLTATIVVNAIWRWYTLLWPSRLSTVPAPLDATVE